MLGLKTSPTAQVIQIRLKLRGHAQSGGRSMTKIAEKWCTNGMLLIFLVLLLIKQKSNRFDNFLYENK